MKFEQTELIIVSAKVEKSSFTKITPSDQLSRATIQSCEVLNLLYLTKFLTIADAMIFFQELISGKITRSENNNDVKHAIDRPIYYEN